MSALKWGKRSSSAIIEAFLQTVSLFSLVQQQDVFFNSKKGRSLSECLKTCLLLKKPLWKHPFMAFTKINIVRFEQLWRKFSFIWAKLRYFGYFESLLHLSESKTVFSLGHVFGP